VGAATPSAPDLPTASATRTAWAVAPGVLLTGVAGGIAFPILPIVGVKAGLPLAFIGAILAANRATRVVSSPFVGVLSDRIGGRRTLMVGMATQVAVMVLYTLGITTGRPGLYFLLGRLLHGPGSALVFVGAQALALNSGGRSHGGVAAGIVRGSIALGIPIGLVAGGLLSDWLGDAATFESAIATLVLATGACYALVPDVRGAIGRTRPGLRDTLRTMGNRRILGIGSLNFVLSFSVGGMVLTTLALLVRQRHIVIAGLGEKGTSGILLCLMIVPSGVIMPFAGRLGDRLRAHAKIALAGLVILVPALAVVAIPNSVTYLMVGLLLMALANAALGPSLLAMMGDSVPPDRRGMSAGMLQLCGDVGGTLGPLMGTALFAGGAETPYLATAGLTVCFIPVAVWLVSSMRGID
jgi:MFS family permease